MTKYPTNDLYKRRRASRTAYKEVFYSPFLYKIIDKMRKTQHFAISRIAKILFILEEKRCYLKISLIFFKIINFIIFIPLAEKAEIIFSTK